jgi:hypothetical protein
MDECIDDGNFIFPKWCDVMFMRDVQIMISWFGTPSSGVHSPRSGSTTATIAQIPDVSSKDGAVIGAVLSTRKLHRGHH